MLAIVDGFELHRLETLAAKVADAYLATPQIAAVRARVAKHGALRFACAGALKIVRGRAPR